MELEKLSSEELAILERQIAEKKKQEAQTRQEKKQQYNHLVNAFVEDNFQMLVYFDNALRADNERLHQDAQAIISLKKDAFDINDKTLDNQQSHTFTDDQNRSIIVGSNTVDGWDDTLVNVGVVKVNEWLASKLNKDNESLINIIKSLLRPNKDGILKANRVLELAAHAQKIGDIDLIEAVKVIQEAYQPKRTSVFIKAKYRDQNGKDVWLNLSMTR